MTDKTYKWEVSDDGAEIFCRDYYIDTQDLVTDMHWMPHLAEKEWVDLKDLFLTVNRAFRICGYAITESHRKARREALKVKADDLMHAVVKDEWMHSKRPDLLGNMLFRVSDIKSEEQMLEELKE